MAEIQNIIELTFTEADGSAFAASALESANNAAESATNAFGYASAASDSAEESAESARLSNQFAVNAYDRASAAFRAKEAAETSATNAATSEANASNSATSASESAATATTKANEASQSATAASNTLVSVINNKNQTQQYYIDAMSYANSAEGYADDAMNSAFQADQSAQAASASATSASTSETNASGSATTATTKASEASQSATTATAKATEAAQSAQTATSAATTAQNVLNSIPADYTTLSNDVNDLKADFDEVTETENLFNKDTAISGRRLDTGGYPYTDENNFLSAYIPVDVGITYTKNSPTVDGLHRMATYNNLNGAVRVISDSNTVTIEEGEVSVRFTGLLTEIDTATFTAQPSAIDRVARLALPTVETLQTDMYQVVDRRPTYVILDFDQDIESLTDNRVTLVNEQYGYPFTFVGISQPSVTRELLKRGCDLSIYSNKAGYLPNVSTINSTSETDIAAWDAYVKEVLDRYNAAGFYNQTCWACQGNNYGSALETALKKYGFKMARGNEVGGSSNSIYIDNFDDNSFRVGYFQIYTDMEGLTLQQVTNAVNNGKDIVIFTHKIVDSASEDRGYDCTKATYTAFLEGLKTKEEAGQVKIVSFREYYKMHCPKSNYEYDYNRIVKQNPIEEVEDIASAVQTLDDLLEVTNTPVEVTGTEYQGYYLNESSQIKSIANTAFRIIKYPVTAGVRYNVHGTQCKLPLAVYPMAGFDTVDFTGSETVACDATIIPAGETNVSKNYDIDYVAPANGYIYVWYSTTATANHLYVAEYVTASGRIKDKKPLKIQLFGDSITDDVWGDQTTWATILQNYMSDYDLTIINSAVAGSAIGYRGKSSAGRYSDKTYNYVCDLMVDGTLDTTADVIIVLIGTNNYGGSFPRIGALGDCGVINEDQTGTGFDIYGSAQFITNKVTTDTHALLLWVTPPQRYNTFDQGQPVNTLGEPLNNLSYTLRELSNAIADCANFNGVPCLNLTASLGWNKRNVASFTTDGLHPNTTGDEWLAQIISSEIMKHLHN